MAPRTNPVVDLPRSSPLIKVDEYFTNGTAKDRERSDVHMEAVGRGLHRWSEHVDHRASIRHYKDKDADIEYRVSLYMALPKGDDI